MTKDTSPHDRPAPGSWQLLIQFLRLGALAFGGPAAHIGLMQRELVHRLKWVRDSDYLDFVGAVNLIPGPNSTQLTMLVGYKLRGFTGMLATGFGFVIPAALITGLLAWLYVRMGSVPAVEGLMLGLKPAVIAVIAAAILSLGRKALKNRWLIGLGLISLAAMLLGLSEITTILAAGALALVLFAIYKQFIKKEGSGRGNAAGMLALPLLSMNPGRAGMTTGIGMAAGATLTTFSLWKLFWVFAKIGALLFGSGYVLVAYLDGELVEKLGWISRAQLLDAIAIGQFTPGPILSAATFVGYILAGIPGAIVATLGIFLPSFLFIMLLYPLIPRMRKNPYTAVFLDSVTVAAVAAMAAVSLSMAIETAGDWRQALILSAALPAALFVKRLSSVWIILGGGLAGFLLHYLSQGL